MAIIGNALTAPESGWRRYDSTANGITYTGTWTKTTSASSYNGTISYTNTTLSGAQFSFVGTKFRFIGDLSTDGATSVNVNIDGVDYNMNQSYTSHSYQSLNLEVLNLQNIQHIVQITRVSASNYVYFDAIDIDSTGYLINPYISGGKQAFDLTSMQVGDFIPCTYTALTSGAVGSFSELGTSVATEIPVAGTATPSGSFNFIKADKGLLIADRVVQQSISWDTLNAGKMMEGSNDPMINKLGNPTDLPTSIGFGVAYSNDGNYLAVAHDISPFVTIYKKSGDTFTKLPNPDVLPTGTGKGVTFSSDGTYMSVAHDVSPWITIYKRSGDTFTKLANPSSLPTGTGNGVAFSNDGNYLSIATATTPYITIYKRSGDTFAKLTNPSTLPVGNGNGVAFSNDGTYMSVAHTTAPYITIYKITSGDVFTKLADPTTLPAGAVIGVAFSADGVYMSVAHVTTPFVTIYKRSGDTFTKLANPSVLPASTGRGVAFSNDGNYMAVACSSSPNMTIYKRSGDIFTKIGSPPLPDIGQGVSFSPDCNYIAFAHYASPFVSVYKKQENILIRSLSGGNAYVDYDSKRVVSTLLHGEGADGSTVYTDSSPNPKVWTGNGSAMIKTDNYKFGSSSMYFNGTTDYINTLAHSDFNFGSDNFTIECWVKKSRNGATEYFMGQCDGSWARSSESFQFGFYNDSVYFDCVYGTTEVIINTTNKITDINWHHIVGARFGTNLYVYVDGVQWGTAVIGANAVNNSTSRLTIGRVGDYAGNYFQGYIDEVRITKGTIPDYLKNFVPPTQPYSEPTNTLIGAYSSTTDKGLGAYPPNNEWDKYIVNSDLGGKIVKGDDGVWHWNGTIFSWVKETPIVAMTSNGNRIIRGYNSGVKAFGANASTAVTINYGFRPVLEYLEADAKATDLFK